MSNNLETTRTSEQPKKPPKARKCRICRQEYAPRSMSHTCCSIECSVMLARQKRESSEALQKKAERKEIKARKEKIKTRRDHIKETQIAFNSAVRERDRDKTCISCRTPLNQDAIGGGYDCGHYRSVGSAPHLRFDLRNAHGQCKKCNRYGSGMAVDYRIGLVERIGLAAVEDLESTQDDAKWSVADLKRMRDEFRAMRRELKKGES